MVPKLPITQQEIILQDPWKQTISRDKYLLSDDSVDAGRFRDCVHRQLYAVMEPSTPVHLYTPS